MSRLGLTVWARIRPRPLSGSGHVDRVRTLLHSSGGVAAAVRKRLRIR